MAMGGGDYSREAIILNISVKGGDKLREGINQRTAIIWGNTVYIIESTKHTKGPTNIRPAHPLHCHHNVQSKVKPFSFVNQRSSKLPFFFSRFLETSKALTFNNLVHTLHLKSTVMSPSPVIDSSFSVCTSTGSSSKASVILLILPQSLASDTKKSIHN